MRHRRGAVTASNVSYRSAFACQTCTRLNMFVICKRPSPALVVPRRATARPARVMSQRMDTIHTVHRLPDGVALEKIEVSPEDAEDAEDADGQTGHPPLLFVHGSYHGAWCWAEKWQPYFAERGYKTVSISLRSQAGSERAEGRKFAGTLKTHADDIEDVVRRFAAPPVMIAHSFGGLVAELYASQPRAPLAGMALVASVPPSGNSDIIQRITKRSIWDSARITWGFITKSFLKSSADTRFLFFGPDLDEAELLKYQRLLQDNASPVPLLDVRNLNAELPISAPIPETYNSNAFVGGGAADCVVDVPAVEELARHFGVQPLIWENLGHDVMLDAGSEVVAADLAAWLQTI